jgi:hypothetical protein
LGLVEVADPQAVAHRARDDGQSGNRADCEQPRQLPLFGQVVQESRPLTRGSLAPDGNDGPAILLGQAAGFNK